MNTKKIRIFNIFSLLFNLAIFILTAYAVISIVFGNEGGNMSIGTQAFRYFTVLSNIYVALTALIYFPYNIIAIYEGRDNTPQWVKTFKFTGTVAVAVTFVTVVLFLGFVYGFGPMFVGQNLFMHLITPLLAIIGFIFFDHAKPQPKGTLIWEILPVVFYSILYIVNVVVVPVWPDFYNFTFGGKLWAAPISLIVMYTLTWGLGVGIRTAHNAMHRLSV